MNYLDIYNLETYLFETVRNRFYEQGYLSAFDFFCIVIWKSNRAKSLAAKRLLSKGYDDLDAAVYALTAGLSKLVAAKDRLQYLWDWGQWELRLPTASAILSVLYPDEFTVYDTRVCGVLGGFRNLGDISNFEKLWPKYLEFKEAVEQSAPTALSLRDKYRYLWGKSFSAQLVMDIQQGFPKTSTDD